MTKFKVGDRVKVTRSFRTDEGKDHLMWSTYMEKYVGSEQAVTETNECGHVQLDCGWWFYPFVLEHVKTSPAAGSFEVGDRVLVTRKLRDREDDHNCGWLPPMDDMVEKEYIIEEISEHGNYRLGGFYFPPAVLRRVSRSPAARILFEKVMVNGTKCRKITGFEGILRKDALPAKYLEVHPTFWLDTSCGGRHVFRDGRFCWDGPNCNGIRLNLPRDVCIDVGEFGFTGIQEGSVWPETTYQELLVWLKRAGSRLAKIRQQEREAWSGSGADEI